MSRPHRGRNLGGVRGLLRSPRSTTHRRLLPRRIDPAAPLIRRWVGRFPAGRVAGLVEYRGVGGLPMGSSVVELGEFGGEFGAQGPDVAEQGERDVADAPDGLVAGGGDT